MVRRHTSLLAPYGLVACADTTSPPWHRRPNIVLVMTDDQGWAQPGMRGAPDRRTLHLDRPASASASFRRFYAAPFCAPTRASLMTGRHAYRTGVTDTWLGRALMAPDETRIAEVLGETGHRTGLFGKWHLGDGHPMRPQDQGFQEVLVHRGGALALDDVRISRALPPETASIPLDGLQWPAGRATPDVRVTAPDGRDHGVVRACHATLMCTHP